MVRSRQVDTRDYRHRYTDEQRKRLLENKRRYYEKNKDKIKIYRDAYAKRTVAERRVYNKKYRETVRLEHKRNMRQHLWDHLLAHPCVDCGEADPVVLEFDHVTGKKRFAIAYALSYSLKTVMEEIGKCAVRCANCHRRKTFADLKHHKHLRPDQYPKGMMGQGF